MRGGQCAQTSLEERPWLHAGPAWSVLYALMGTSSWLVWKNGGGWIPLSLYGVQLALNFAW